jgi:hypothetical protein
MEIRLRDEHEWHSNATFLIEAPDHPLHKVGLEYRMQGGNTETRGFLHFYDIKRATEDPGDEVFAAFCEYERTAYSNYYVLNELMRERQPRWPKANPLTLPLGACYRGASGKWVRVRRICPEKPSA